MPQLFGGFDALHALQPQQNDIAVRAARQYLHRLFAVFIEIEGLEAFGEIGGIAPGVHAKLPPDAVGPHDLAQLQIGFDHISGMTISTSLPSLAERAMPSMMAWLYRIWLEGTGALPPVLTASMKKRILL